MLKQTLYQLVMQLSVIHHWISQLNNDFEYNFSDKELHLLVVGLAGMVIFFLVHPVIRFLARRGWEMAISWCYTMTLLIVLTFGIEIGQKVTGTGNMEFADIVFGIAGFLLMFLGYTVILLIWKGICKLIAHFRKE